MENGSYFLMNVNADLAGRGCIGLTNDWLNWTYEKTSADSGVFLAPTSGEWPLYPGTADNFYYTIPKDQVIGWESVSASMVANAGAVNFTFQLPITCTQTSTNGTSFGWLKAHNLVADTNRSASYAAAALADPDSDGFANWQEYIAASDPNSSNSFFRITVADSALSWHSATVRVYTVKGATNLTDTFTFITNFTGIAGTLSYTNAGTDGFRFYRVQAELAP
jgi:hypothetical protein